MAYGFRFRTKDGRDYRLDDINPAIFLESIYITGNSVSPITRSYPELNNICEVFAVLIKASHDNPYATGRNVTITPPSSSPAQVTLTTAGGNAGSNAYYHFVIYARSIV